MPGSIARSARRVALAALLLGAAGCADRGDPILPAETLTGRWAVDGLATVDGVLELREEASGISGRLILSEDGLPLGEYPITGGTGGADGFSFVLDPLNPPILGFLEKIGSAAPIHVNGALETHETLRLDVSQECGEPVCLEAAGEAAFATPLFNASGPLTRFIQTAEGMPPLLAELSLNEVGENFEGALSIIIGSAMGGRQVLLPVHPVFLTDPDSIVFYVDPLEARGDTLEHTLGCDEWIFFLGTLDQGSTVRFLIAQIDTVAGAEPCNFGQGNWAAYPVLDNLTSRLSATIAGEVFDVVVSTRQTGSVIEGSVTFENDRIRYGPLPIDGGRFARAVADLVVHPSDAVGTDFVDRLGSAAPIDVQIRLADSKHATVTVRQDCPCLETTIVANRLNIGI